MSGDALEVARTSTATDWLALWGAVGPLVGAVIGAVLTHVGTSRLQARQLRNENSVRFHERRVEACLDFLHLATEISFRKSTGDATDAAQMLALSRAENSIRMLMGPDVVAAMNGISNTVHLHLASGREGLKGERAFGDAMVARFRAFTDAVRKALGVEIRAPEPNGGKPDAR